MTEFEKHLRAKRQSPAFRARQEEVAAMRASAKAALWNEGAIALDDAGVVRALRFACTGCGKCCDTPPGMNLADALRLADRFVLKAELRSVAQIDPEIPFDQHHLDVTYPDLDLDGDPGRRERFSENLTAQAKALGTPVSFRDGPASDVALRVMFTDMMDDTGSCPMRQEDGFCRIYGARPAKCRLVPFDESIPLEDAGDAAAFSIMRLLMQRDGACTVDRTAPVIWEDGEFTDAEIEQAHEEVLLGASDAERAATRAVTEEVVLCKVRETGIARADLERYCVTRDTAEPAPMTSMVPVLHRLVAEAAIAPEHAIGVLEKQIQVIEDRLAKVSPEAAPHPAFGATYATMLQDWLDLYRTIAADWRAAEGDETASLEP